MAHCLRALCCLRKGAVAEELIRNAVVGPFVRSAVCLLVMCTHVPLNLHTIIV